MNIHKEVNHCFSHALKHVCVVESTLLYSSPLVETNGVCSPVLRGTTAEISCACGSSVFFTAVELNGLVEKWTFSQGSERMLWKAETWKIRTGRFTTAAAFLCRRSSKLLYSRNMNVHPYIYTAYMYIYTAYNGDLATACLYCTSK